MTTPRPTPQPGDVSLNGVYSMPDLPVAERTILGILDADDSLTGEHVCQDLAADPAEYYGNCNCGATVRFAVSLAAALTAALPEMRAAWEAQAEAVLRDEADRLDLASDEMLGDGVRYAAEYLRDTLGKDDHA